MVFNLKQRSSLPGFGLTLGLTRFYLSLMVLIPFSMIFLKTATLGWGEIWEIVTDARVVASYRLSLSASLVAALINTVFGLLVAWVLVRYQFVGKRIVDGLVDLPFALPTAVAGISLTAIYSENGWLGRPLHNLGIEAAFTPLGVVIALVFMGLPLAVRTIQPVLGDLDVEIEEAAASLGATRWQAFLRVILPDLVPGLITGFALAFARALGEYGPVVVISGNMPFKTELTRLLIMTKLEQYDYAGAAAIAVVMLLLSFVVLLAVNLLQRWSSRRLAMN